MNVKSIILMMFLGVLVTSMAAAETADTGVKESKDSAAFQAAKEQRIANLQERLQLIQAHINCTQAAQDHAAMKACHATAKNNSDALEAKLKAQRSEKKAKTN